MRILHFSDVHIGVESYGSIDPSTGLSARLADFLSTFDEVVDFALNNSVDLALFAGDAYKSRDPSQTHQREFARRIARLSREGVPVFLLVGNHDIPHIASRATALGHLPNALRPQRHHRRQAGHLRCAHRRRPGADSGPALDNAQRLPGQGGDPRPHHRGDKPAAGGAGHQPTGLADREA